MTDLRRQRLLKQEPGVLFLLRASTLCCPSRQLLTRKNCKTLSSQSQGSARCHVGPLSDTTQTIWFRLVRKRHSDHGDLPLPSKAPGQHLKAQRRRCETCCRNSTIHSAP